MDSSSYKGWHSLLGNKRVNDNLGQLTTGTTGYGCGFQNYLLVLRNTAVHPVSTPRPTTQRLTAQSHVREFQKTGFSSKVL